MQSELKISYNLQADKYMRIEQSSNPRRFPSYRPEGFGETLSKGADPYACI